MLNPEMSTGTTYNLHIRQTLAHGAGAFARMLYRLKPGPVLIIIAVEALVQFCLATRIYYAFQGGSPEGLTLSAYNLSDSLVDPFRNWDGTVVMTRGVFEISTIVAMDVYLFAGVGAIVVLVMLRSFAGFAHYVARQRRIARDRRLAAAIISQVPVSRSAAPETAADKQAA